MGLDGVEIVMRTEETFGIEPLKEILRKDQWPQVWAAIRAEVGQPNGRPRSAGRAC
jgi:hypothetical protein